MKGDLGGLGFRESIDNRYEDSPEERV